MRTLNPAVIGQGWRQAYSYKLLILTFFTTVLPMTRDVYYYLEKGNKLIFFMGLSPVIIDSVLSHIYGDILTVWSSLCAMFTRTDVSLKESTS